MMESIEGLREYIKEHYNMGSYAYDEIMSHVQATEREISERFVRIPTTNTGEPRACAADVEAMLKAIAEEDWEFFDGVRERYMPLPVDADGVVWTHVDDLFIDKLGEKHAMEAMTIDHDGEWMLRSPLGWYRASVCRHVKQCTVEDVLREFAKSGTPTGEGGVLFETALIEKYADKLRDLFGGDAS